MSNEPKAMPSTQIRPHYRLEAWKESIALVKRVYEITREFPREEIYGLISQMRRAAVSIPSNLAEGAARTGSREFAQFLNMARGSLSELETQLIIAAELCYIDNDNDVFAHIDKVSRLVTGLHKSVKD